MQQKRSKLFRDTAKGARVGADFLTAIRKHQGRSGDGINDATIVRWAAEGLVTLERRAPKGDEHHRSRPIARVVLTQKGADARSGKSAPFVTTPDAITDDEVRAPEST